MKSSKTLRTAAGLALGLVLAGDGEDLEGTGGYIGTLKLIPPPGFRIFPPGGREHRKARGNKGQPGGRNWGVGISFWLLATGHVLSKRASLQCSLGPQRQARSSDDFTQSKSWDRTKHPHPHLQTFIKFRVSEHVIIITSHIKSL